MLFLEVIGAFRSEFARYSPNPVLTDIHSPKKHSPSTHSRFFRVLAGFFLPPDAKSFRAAPDTAPP